MANPFRNRYVNPFWQQDPETFLHFLISHAYRIASTNLCAFKGAIIHRHPYKVKLEVDSHLEPKKGSCVITINILEDPNEQIVEGIIDLLDSLELSYPTVHLCCPRLPRLPTDAEE